MSSAPSCRWMAAGLLHEWMLAALGVSTGALLVVRQRAFVGLAAEALAVPIVWFAVVLALARARSDAAERGRLVVTYLYIFWFYSSIRRFVPALGCATWDETFCAWDERMFGVLPVTLFSGHCPKWLTELMSACYFSYLLYLHGVFLHALLGTQATIRRLLEHAGMAYVVGMTGYLLFPAVGPQNAYAERLVPPLAGGMVTDAVAGLVAWGSCLYDVFPSLHVLLTLALLEFDRRNCRWRFLAMLVPACGIIGSTVYLHYHYVVDLLAGAVVFTILKLTGLFEPRCNAAHGS